MTEFEMVGWHHQLKGHEFEQALGVGDGQGSLVCCSPWGRKESHTTEQLNCSTLGFPVHHQLPELAQTHVYRVGDAIKPPHPVSAPSAPAFNLSQHQGLFK